MHDFFMKNRIPISVFLLTALAFSNAFAQGFLTTNGNAIVNENGDTVILRGMGLGGWMLQEGYMLQPAGFAGPQWQIRNKIEQFIGEANTDLFYEKWLENHVRKIDIDSLKARFHLDGRLANLDDDHCECQSNAGHPAVAGGDHRAEF